MIALALLLKLASMLKRTMCLGGQSGLLAQFIDREGIPQLVDLKTQLDQLTT